VKGAGADPGQDPNDPIGLRAGALALIASILWGGNSVFIKVGLADMPPVALALARFMLGAATVWCGARIFRQRLGLVRGEYRGLLVLAGIFFVQILLLNQGTHYTTAGRSTILMSAYPFFTAIFAHFFLPGDRLSAAKVGGLCLAFAGVGLVFSESVQLGDTGYMWGDLMVLVSAAFLGMRHIALKKLVGGLHPFKVLFWQAGFSLPAFLLLSLLTESGEVFHWTGGLAFALFYQGVVVAGLCFIIWVFLLKNHSASRLGVYGFSTPLFGVVLSAVLLGEQLSLLVLGGAALVALGIVAVNRAG
jgi:drug/metabolite transporter (DMT)-like permease